MNQHKFKSAMPPANDADHTDEQLDQKIAADAAPETLPIDIVRKNFPRIAERIELLWSTWELQQYFMRILIDDRGDREGFPVEVVSALLKIYQDHCKIAPTEDPANRYKKNNDLWLDD